MKTLGFVLVWLGYLRQNLYAAQAGLEIYYVVLVSLELK